MYRLPSALLLLWAGFASAHNPLDHPDWCAENGRLVVVDQFEWDGDTLARWVEKQKEEGSCPRDGQGGIGTRTCGQFDDDWRMVNSNAANHCDRFAVRFVGATHPDHGTVIHLAEGPEAFLDEQAHHDGYRAKMGLRALCVRCEPVELEPVGPGEPVRPGR